MNQFLANIWHPTSQPDSEKMICNQILLNYFLSINILLDYLNQLPKEYLYRIIKFLNLNLLK